MNFNSVTLCGRLVDAVRVTAGDPSKNIDKRAWGRIAVNRPGKDAPYDVFNICAWGTLADVLEKYTAKGKELLIQGTLRTNNKVREGGGYDNYTEVVVSSVQLGADSGKGKAAEEPQTAPSTEAVSALVALLANGGADVAKTLASLIEAKRTAQAEPPAARPTDDFPM